MKIVSLNKNIERYHFLNEMEYENPSFKGHQTALALGLVNPATGIIEQNYVSGADEEEKTGIFRAMLDDKSLILLEDKITQLENGQIVPKIMYYLPYYVEGHTAYKPTVNFANISYSVNVRQTIEWEVVLADDEGWYNRYLTFTTVTGPAGYVGRCCNFYEMIEGLEDALQEKLDRAEDTDITLATEEGEDYDEGDIIIDFYDKAGQKTFVSFSSCEDILKYVTSVRMVDYKSEIVKDDELPGAKKYKED